MFCPQVYVSLYYLHPAANDHQSVCVGGVGSQDFVGIGPMLLEAVFFFF